MASCSPSANTGSQTTTEVDGSCGMGYLPSQRDSRGPSPTVENTNGRFSPTSPPGCPTSANASPTLSACPTEPVG